MRHLALTTPFALLLLVLFGPGCSSPTEPDDPPDTTSINEDIVQIFDATSRGRNRQYLMATWPRRETIYATAPLSALRVNDDLELVGDSVFVWEGRRFFVEADKKSAKLLYVLSEYGDASVGALYEFAPKTGKTRLLRDSTHAVSSAIYLPGSDGEEVVYYSYGSVPELGNDGPTPGYYLHDTSTDEDSLLLKHRSPAGTEEAINGFDISPDGQTLLYPLQYDNIRDTRSPQVVRYNLTSSAADTLDWEFGQQLLWLRYDPDGRQLLYGNYPEDALSHTIVGRPQIGIIDLQDGTRRTLDTRTNPGEGGSMDVFPRWSSSGRQIVYGSAPVAKPSGAIGNYSLYVLKNVN